VEWLKVKVPSSNPSTGKKKSWGPSLTHSLPQLRL
jgi:hypothetical protein